MKSYQKNIILFIGRIPDRYVEAIERIEKKLNKTFRIALIADLEAENELSSKYEKRLNYLIKCDIKNVKKIKGKLSFIKNEIFTVYFISEKNASLYCDLYKLLNLKDHPSVSSIMKSTDKLKTRKALYRLDPSITPKFIQIKNSSSTSTIEKKVGFPCILKPAHLSRSRLITIAENRIELKESIKKIFNSIDKTYKKEKIKHKPTIVAEELLHGEEYTIDIYINKNGKIYFTPPIFQITARDIQINDFHIYARISPHHLNDNEIKKVKKIVRNGVKALGLRNVLAFFELKKTKDGWKIIEVGPRIPAYRTGILYITYGIRHIDNYILLRLGKKPVVNDKPILNSAVLEFFPEKEGYIKSIKGIRKIKKLKSFLSLFINIKIGHRAGLSKEGYFHTLRVKMKNKDKNEIYRDIDRARKLIKIKVKDKT